MSVSRERSHSIQQQRIDDSRRRSTAASAARAVDRSTRDADRRAGSGRRGGGAIAIRSRRAPASASQFHLHVKRSNRAGSRRSPASAVSKILYDLGLDKPGADARIAGLFVHLPNDCPQLADDPLLMAQACETRAAKEKYANSCTGQMLHFDIALPNFLDAHRQAALAKQINESLSEALHVPSYAAVHDDRGNAHLHASLPLYAVQDDGAGGYVLSDRIMHAQRPALREAAGLSKSKAGELAAIRATVANLIANSVAEQLANEPPHIATHIVERWRCGHFKLEEQVIRAAQRGDIEFVEENAERDPTKKEGPGARRDWPKQSRDERRHDAKSHNENVHDGVESITKASVQRALRLADAVQINDPEQLRQFLRDQGITMRYVGTPGQKARGVTYQLNGGPSLSGRSLNASLGDLKRRYEWSETPAYRRNLSLSSEQQRQYQDALSRSQIRPTNLADAAPAAVQRRAEKLREQAAKAAPLAGSAPAKGVGQRSKRRSNDSSFNKRTTTPAPGGRPPASGRAAPEKPLHEVKNMTIDSKALLASLSALPVDETTVAAAGAVGSAAICAVRETMPNSIKPHTLSEQQKRLLLDAFDQREAAKTGSFDGPLSRTQEQLERLNQRISQHQQSEPEGGIYLKKRLFRTPILSETDEHRKWRESLEKGREHAQKLESQISKMQKSAFNDPDLLRALPQLAQASEERQSQQRAAALESATEQYQKAVEQLDSTPPGTARERLFRTIKIATDEYPELAEQERERRANRASEEAARRSPQRHDDDNDDYENRRRNRSRER
ncbi:hypothetical protein [Alcaligenes faecalis]|uniref:hypothetical protein n=1 Tax=Alcaligenes faecalis TaxID=511 RepID=UPI00214FF58D|nr:hypothetical protein [Alcaligenes faecalis]MCR4143975.1 hypothetical protein [Alcaligenes faecalis]